MSIGPIATDSNNSAPLVSNGRRSPKSYLNLMGHSPGPSTGVVSPKYEINQEGERASERRKRMPGCDSRQKLPRKRSGPTQNQKQKQKADRIVAHAAVPRSPIVDMGTFSAAKEDRCFEMDIRESRKPSYGSHALVL